MDAPPRPPPPWETLMDALVREIAIRLPCKFDRVRFVTVCKPWRESLSLPRLPAPDPPPALPLLILPLNGDEGPAATVSCVLSDHATHRVAVPGWARRGRYIGAYDGGWVMFHVPPPQDPHGHFLLNLDRHIALPNRYIALEAGEDGEILQGPPRPMSIVAATLSSQPDIGGCVFAGIVNIGPVRPMIAFWRAFDMLVPAVFEHHHGGVPWQVEDVVHHHGAFYFLTQGEHIIVGEPDFQGWDEEIPGVNWELRHFLPNGRAYEQYREARYLVESGEDLLMVVRCSPHPGQPTSSFKVFQMAQPDPDPKNPPADDIYIWKELHSLEGRMLFVGRGCSRSYRVDQYPGFFKEGIYFFDDQAIHNPVVPQQDGAPRYRCSDCGKWAKTPAPLGHVERVFPAQGPSNYSPQDSFDYLWLTGYLLNIHELVLLHFANGRMLRHYLFRGKGKLNIMIMDRTLQSNLLPANGFLGHHLFTLIVSSSWKGCVVAGFVHDNGPVPGHDRQKIAFWGIYDDAVIGYFFACSASYASLASTSNDFRSSFFD
uniref:KIB1-4 beta-propeller domain-containing protein n=1 Tax=Leersia perrieri TaxID=77586 RepID=A0A0D9V6C8_9ORYZ